MGRGWGGIRFQCNIDNIVVIIRLVFEVSEQRKTFWPPVRQSRKWARTPPIWSPSRSQVVASCRLASVRARMTWSRLLRTRQPRVRRHSVSTWLSEVLRRPRDLARVSWPCWCPPRRLKSWILGVKKWIHLWKFPYIYDNLARYMTCEIKFT